MLIKTREQFLHAVTILIEADVIVVDTETQKKDKDHYPDLLGISTYCKMKGRDPYEISFYFPFDHKHDPNLFRNVDNLPKEWLRELAGPLEREDVTLIFHNNKFDRRVLWKAGIHPKGIIRDTIILVHMVNENELNFALKVLGRKYIKEDAGLREKQIKKIEKALTWPRIPPDVMAIYAEEDVFLTHGLYEKFLPKIHEEELSHLLDREHRFSEVLGKLEDRGIVLITQRAKDLAWEAECQIKELLSDLGFDPGKPSQLARKLFAAEPEGLGLLPGLLTKRKLSPPITLSNGRSLSWIPVMDEAALSRFHHPIIEKVLQFRDRVKANSMWFQGYLDLMWSDGRIHPSYKQHGTVTTRLSCTKPNVQQIPKVDPIKREQVRSVLGTTPGFQLWGFDYSQIEFRLGACYAGGEIAEAYRQGIDFHTLTAQKLGIPRDREGGKINGKDTNFMALYGGGDKKFAEVLGLKLEHRDKIEIPEHKPYWCVNECCQARVVRRSWWAEYPDLQRVRWEVQRLAEKRGWIRYWNGRKRHFLYPSEAHKAFNSLLQGGAAQIVEETMIKIDDTYPDLRMIAQVHDEIWFELPEDEAEEWVKKIRVIMEWPSEKFPVPFDVDSKRIR